MSLRASGLRYKESWVLWGCVETCGSMGRGRDAGCGMWVVTAGEMSGGVLLL